MSQIRDILLDHFLVHLLETGGSSVEEKAKEIIEIKIEGINDRIDVSLVNNQKVEEWVYAAKKSYERTLNDFDGMHVREILSLDIWL